MPRPRRHRYGCTYARLLRHETEPNTTSSSPSSLTLAGARGCERAAALELGGEGLAHAVRGAAARRFLQQMPSTLLRGGNRA